MKITINGKDIEINNSDSLVIEVEGDLSELNVIEGINVANVINTNAFIGDIKVCVNGNVEKVKTTNGSVSIKGESGDIKTTNGNISISKDVNGDIKTTNGNVFIEGDFTGKVKTVNGNISKKRGE